MPLPIQANFYVWDNQNGTGIWNDPVNWGLTNNWGYNVEPTASDSANFVKGAIYYSPTGAVTLTADGFAQKIRQEFSRVQRSITIGPSQTVDRTLTLSGTASGLRDFVNAAVNFALDGTPNAYGARLKLKLNGSGTGTRTSINKAVTLTVSCDVSGAGGFILNGGEDGPGILVLSGVNTYTGPTTVNSGTILVNGSTAAGSTVTVKSGGVMGGTGTINGPVTVAADGLLSPGVLSNKVATLTLSHNLTLAGDLLIEVNKSLAKSNDMVMVSGTLNNTGAGVVQVLNMGAVLQTGDRFQIFNKALLNGQALLVLSAGHEVWTNKLAVDGSIEVLSATNTPITGDPANVFMWNGTVTTDEPWKVPMQTAANWLGYQSPPPLSSNILIFQGDLPPPYNWPYIDTDYGTSILIFSNNAVLNSIKILAGSNHTVNLGSYVRQDTYQPCYFGIVGSVPIMGADGSYHTVYCANFTNALGDASCGSQTEFQCVGGRLDAYGVLRNGAGTSSRLVKSGNHTLNLTGDQDNLYTGGTIINEGNIKMAKPFRVNAIPGDVTVNGTAGLVINAIGGEQIADTAIVTLNHSSYFDMTDENETIRIIQSLSPNTRIYNVHELTVAPLAGETYNGGIGVSDFAGSISGGGTVQMNGTGIFRMLGANSISRVTVNSGTVHLNGNSGSATINSGGTLLGKGSITRTVTVNSGGTFSAGFGAGKATLSYGFNMRAGGNGPTNVWELATLKDDATGVAGADFDQIILTAFWLELGAQATLDIQFIDSATAPDFGDPFWQSLHTWRIILLSGGSNPDSSDFGRIKNGTYPAGKFTTTADASGILLTYTPSVAPPRITAITDAGTGAVTVQYTNTLPGTNYVLSYNTNLNSPNWFSAGSKTATGTGDSQTDVSATGNQRYYRIYYVTP